MCTWESSTRNFHILIHRVFSLNHSPGLSVPCFYFAKSWSRYSLKKNRNNHYAIYVASLRILISCLFPFLYTHSTCSLNVRIVLLIRDPRGFLQSRKHRGWCPGNPDCDNPTVVCKDMISDYKAAVDAAKKFPMTFKWVSCCRTLNLNFAYSLERDVRDLSRADDAMFNCSVIKY